MPRLQQNDHGLPVSCVQTQVQADTQGEFCVNPIQIFRVYIAIDKPVLIIGDYSEEQAKEKALQLILGKLDDVGDVQVEKINVYEI